MSGIVSDKSDKCARCVLHLDQYLLMSDKLMSIEALLVMLTTNELLLILIACLCVLMASSYCRLSLIGMRFLSVSALFER